MYKLLLVTKLAKNFSYLGSKIKKLHDVEELLLISSISLQRSHSEEVSKRQNLICIILLEEPVRLTCFYHFGCG